MKRARAAKMSVILLSLSSAGLGDQERRRGLDADRCRSNGSRSAERVLLEKLPPRPKFELT